MLMGIATSWKKLSKGIGRIAKEWRTVEQLEAAGGEAWSEELRKRSRNGRHPHWPHVGVVPHDWNPTGDPSIPWPPLVFDEYQRITWRCAAIYYPYRAVGDGHDSCPEDVRKRLIRMLNSRPQTAGSTPATRPAETTESRIAAINTALRQGGQRLDVQEVTNVDGV